MPSIYILPTTLMSENASDRTLWQLVPDVVTQIFYAD